MAFNQDTSHLKPSESYIRGNEGISIDELADDIASPEFFYQMQMQNQKQVAADKIRQRNAVIIIVIILFIISVAVAGALYKQRKTQMNINRLLIAKNEQIRMQSEEIQVQAEEVSKLNQDLEFLNQNLENKIRSRTRILKNQNNLLAEYAYSNAHELRAPVASVMGLVDLLNRSNLAGEEKEIVEHLRKSASELARIVKDIRIRLERNDVLFFDEKDNG